MAIREGAYHARSSSNLAHQPLQRVIGSETSVKVIEALADVIVERGVPEHLRSDNGPEFVAKDLRQWLVNTGANTLYIEPGSPWETGYCESFNSKLRDDFLKGEIFYSIKELRVLAGCWRIYYNTIRPHSSLGYKPPAPEAWQTEASPGHGKLESTKRFPLFHARRRRLSELSDTCAKLTLRWHKTSGRPAFQLKKRGLSREAPNANAWQMNGPAPVIMAMSNPKRRPPKAAVHAKKIR